MEKKFTVILMTMVFLMCAVGIAGAQALQPQTLLPGAWIPQFAHDLPVATTAAVPGITAVDVTGGGPYNINIMEFRAEILPTIPPVPATRKTPGFAGLTNPQSWVWGYLTDADVSAGGVRPSYLGPVVVAQRNTSVQVNYVNGLPSGDLSWVLPLLPIDQTLDWADPLKGGCAGADIINQRPDCAAPYRGLEIPVAVHLHGGEVAAQFDGGPDAWFTQGFATTGKGWPGNPYTYPNQQQAGTIWFHDHALGITRLNVYAGLAGLYYITDPTNEPPKATQVAGGTGVCPTTNASGFPFGGCLPNAAYDIPLIIQDRSFDQTGQIFYNLASNPQPNPTVHPFWIPEFIGDTIVVNGKVWPRFQVEPRKYRFRLVNGSNARFYDLSLTYPVTTVVRRRTIVTPTPVPFQVIATDDGYLPAPTAAINNLIIGPGERYEIIVDFTQVPSGTWLTMMNAARTPFPGGAAPVVGLTDTVMQFRVTKTLDATIADATLPTSLRPNNAILNIFTGWTAPAKPPAAPSGSILRQLTLNEVIGPGGPLELVVNNSKYNLAGILPGGCPTTLCRETELPAVGDTEVWEIINITADAHPMHTHLASFQIIDRTPIPRVSSWITQYDTLLRKNGVLPGMGPPNPYSVRNADGAIGGNPPVWNGPRPAGIAPAAYEVGWKDTAIMYPGEVTRIVIRWAETDASLNTTTAGVNTYPFDPGAMGTGVGYVWHCHIIDHEDNEMMRNYVVGTQRQPVQ